MPFIQLSLPVNVVNNEKYVFDRALQYHVHEPSLEHISSCWWVPFNEKPLNGFLSKFKYLLKNFILKREIKAIFKAAWVVDSYSKNYFHWFNDVLPRILFLKTIQSDCLILIPQDLKEISYIKDSLVLFSLDIFVVSRDGLYIIDNLFIPKVGSPGCQDSIFFPAMVKILRAQVRNNRLPSRKLFLARGENYTRGILPFSEVEKVLIENEFEIVYADKLSIIDQAELFSSASHLISVHGAGLTNMLYMQPNNHVMEIRRRDDLLNYCYFFMAQNLGLNYFYFMADSAGISKVVQADQFLIDSVSFSEKIKDFLNYK